MAERQWTEIVSANTYTTTVQRKRKHWLSNKNGGGHNEVTSYNYNQNIVFKRRLLHQQ